MPLTGKLAASKQSMAYPSRDRDIAARPHWQVELAMTPAHVYIAMLHILIVLSIDSATSESSTLTNFYSRDLGLFTFLSNFNQNDFIIIILLWNASA